MYDWSLYEQASYLAFKGMKQSGMQITEKNYIQYTKIAIMFIKTRHNTKIDEFLKFYDSISFPKLERIEKLNLFENFLLIQVKNET
jgi:hypothetical protein